MTGLSVIPSFYINTTFSGKQQDLKFECDLASFLGTSLFTGINGDDNSCFAEMLFTVLSAVSLLIDMELLIGEMNVFSRLAWP